MYKDVLYAGFAGAKTGKAGSRYDTLSTSLKTYWGLLHHDYPSNRRWIGPIKNH